MLASNISNFIQDHILYFRIFFYFALFLPSSTLILYPSFDQGINILGSLTSTHLLQSHFRERFKQYCFAIAIYFPLIPYKLRNSPHCICKESTLKLKTQCLSFFNYFLTIFFDTILYSMIIFFDKALS